MTLDASEKAGVPVVRGLEWRDLRPNAFPDMWCATSACGVYDIEEHSASDSPVYVALGPHYAFIANKDSLEEAKAAAQADYEQRITSALNPDFLSALDTARAANEALMVERTNLIETKRDQLAQAQSALTAAQARIAELEGALTKLESAATKYHRVTEEHFTDTDYYRDGGLAEADAELSVVALPLARATLSPVKEPK